MNNRNAADQIDVLENIDQQTEIFHDHSIRDCANDPVTSGALWEYAIFRLKNDKDIDPISALIMATEEIPQIAKEFLISLLENKRIVPRRKNMERDNIAMNALHAKAGECRYPTNSLFPNDDYAEMLEREGLADTIDSNDQVYEILADASEDKGRQLWPESIEKAVLARRKKEKELREKAIKLMQEASNEQRAANTASLEEAIKHLY